MIEKSNMNIDVSLWNAYSNPFFHFYSKWQVSLYSVITAWNPRSNLQSKEKNDTSNHKLENQLNHVKYVPVTVGDPLFSWFEESYAAELSPQAAIELGRQFQQNAIYYVIDDELYLIACFEPETMHKLGSIKSRLVNKDITHLSPARVRPFTEEP